MLVAFIKNIGLGMVHFVYPQLCYHCQESLLSQENFLCLNCLSDFPFTKYHHLPNNQTALRLAGLVPFVHATSLAYFTAGGILQSLLHPLKYEQKKSVAKFLGQLFSQTLMEAPMPWWQEIDLIVPVPLHRNKEQKRGYNQSVLIAKVLALQFNKQMKANALQRVSDTETQTKKSREERSKNMMDAFAVTDSSSLEGKHILLIDDVLTTGATILACATALQQSVPSIKISVATVGIAID